MSPTEPSPSSPVPVASASTLTGSRLAVGTVVVLALAASVTGFCSKKPDGETGAGPEAPPVGATQVTFEDDGGTQELVIEPENAVLDATGAGATQQFAAKVKGTGQVVPASWAVDVADIGSMGADGTFTSTGTLGGKTRVIAQVGNLRAIATLTVRLTLRDVPAGADAALVQALEAGGSTDNGFRWLYPYDKTVFARGLLPPSLQFGGTASDGFWLRATCQNLDYSAYLPATQRNPSRVTLPEKIWTAMTRTCSGSSDPVKVSVTKHVGAAVTGPIAETWTVAQGSLKGVVYYNSYDSLLARTRSNGQVQADNVGSVMRIRPGSTAEVFLGGVEGKGLRPSDRSQGFACTTCHSVSAQGNMISAAMHTPPNSAVPYYGGLFGVSGTGESNFVRRQDDATNNWAGLYPDGSLMMTNATFAQAPGTFAPNVPGIHGIRPSRLVDTQTGAVINAPGWNVDDAQMASFSADGKRIVFSRGSVAGTTNGARSVWIGDFDRASNTFSNLRELYKHTGTPARYAGWSSMTPDGEWVLFHVTNRADYATWSNNDTPPQSEIHIAHVKTGTTARLDALNGYDETGKLYLPYGDAEARKNFIPTLLPQKVGGYWWVVFTSRRNFGNTAVDGAQNAPPRKKLWVAALAERTGEFATKSATDISFPAFYLSGQELEAGNSRGFWALEACKAPESTCTPGQDSCCDGFCAASTGSDGKQVFKCTPDKPLCASEGEACQTDLDCCDSAQGARCLDTTVNEGGTSKLVKRCAYAGIR